MFLVFKVALDFCFIFLDFSPKIWGLWHFFYLPLGGSVVPQLSFQIDWIEVSKEFTDAEE